MALTPATTILVTGFGPFPGAPFNPTPTLVQAVTRMRTNARIVGHVFRTVYADVDRDLPKLIERHRPDALLMFGLAGRARTVRIETRARNIVARFPDASRATPPSRFIAKGDAYAKPLATPAGRLLAAARAARVPAVASRDAGRYLCNYLCWRAAEARLHDGPRSIAPIVAFIHVPRPAGRKPRRSRKSTRRHRPTLDELKTMARAVAKVMIATSRHPKG